MFLLPGGTGDEPMNRCGWAKDELSIKYHDDEWGVPVHDDHRWFEFLVLEGAQAGLSWDTILRKRENYRRAFADFDPAVVARFNVGKIEKLRVEAARNGRGVLSEIDQGLQQDRVRLHAHAFQVATDLVAPLLGRQNDVVIAQALLIIGDGDGNFPRSETAVPRAESAGTHTGQLNGNDVVAQQGHDPAEGPDELGAALPGSGV